MSVIPKKAPEDDSSYDVDSWEDDGNKSAELSKLEVALFGGADGSRNYWDKQLLKKINPVDCYLTISLVLVANQHLLVMVSSIVPQIDQFPALFRQVIRWKQKDSLDASSALAREEFFHSPFING